MTRDHNSLLLLDDRGKETSIWLARYEGSSYDARSKSLSKLNGGERINLDLY